MSNVLLPEQEVYLSDVVESDRMDRLEEFLQREWDNGTRELKLTILCDADGERGMMTARIEGIGLLEITIKANSVTNTRRR